MSNLSPSKIAKKTVYLVAETAVYKSKGIEYNKELNPYKENTKNFENFEKFYNKIRVKYHRLEVEWKDLMEVYGEI